MKIWFFLLLALVAIVEAKDYYKILDIGKDADDKTIKLAYRRLSKMYHPDKNPSEEAHEKFIEVGEAYEVLSDPEKRKNYDTYGDPNARQDNNMDFGDLFNQFFGGNPMGGGQRRVRRGDNKGVSIKIALKDFYTGSDVTFTIDKNTICSHCEGTGSKDKKTHTCGKCQGQGMVQMRRQLGPGMFQTFAVQCDECNGKGSTYKNKCKQCHGSGVESGQKEYTVYMSPGVERNSQHVLRGEGDESPDWVAGDLIINFQEDLVLNWGYRRVGNNLYRTEVITLEESLLGNWSRKIPHFDAMDPEILIAKSKGEIVINGQVDVLAGKGMPFKDDDDRHGDLYIEYKVLVPETLKNSLELDTDEL